jgi:hypothetical protein
MVYRSDVKAAFYTTEDRAAALKLYVTENFPEDLAGQLKPIDNGHYMGFMFECDGWKWYDSWPEIIAFNKFVSNYLELAEQEEIRWAYEFVRVGEDSDDIEENRSDYSDYQVRPVTSIDSDF